MNLRLNKRQFSLLIILLAVCIAGAAALYWFVLEPVKAEIAVKKSTLKSEQQVLDALHSKQQINPEVQLGTVVDLLQKVPTKPLTEQFLLDFQMAESLSGSLITEMDYNQQKDTSNSASAAQSSSTGSNAALPSGMKKITYTLTVESPDYKSMKSFLKTIENLSRITMIESVDFQQSNQTADSADLEYTVTVSTFYYPELSRYADYLPDIEVPSPSHKSDPIAGTAQ
ncbi:hypothetical protein BpJC7_04800 [Weizmannia acidilactici]|uniref:Pilus assembly protein PilO n=1 Tax=Weizmannia acidilactici TaxID=2607726 RepID=A0A5J4JF85_9BACI|nr:type 4a pilus biogenesis protein PilO [Weizmannia acidilactici]GER66186.1 hypothetical protein BpJC4_06570 [Weizmannia acidilactici]GER69177.1 hypothetical protein BpJC7_04800 [Weizmannia acidilactici]GER72126.1 hypothetical protein BpPP18_01930 [Weizmannia acidilactici]